MGLLFLISIIVAISCRELHAQEMIAIPTATDSYRLSYILDIPSSSVTFQITAETTGFIGFGFSNVSGMISSDIFIGGVDPGGALYFGDYSSVTVGTPRRDTEQNWELLEASETETTTYLQFRRPFETTDPADINITDRLMNIIWALGEDDTIRYHGFSRSNLKFNLISGTNGGEEPEPPPTLPPTTIRTTVAATTPFRIDNEIPLGSELIQINYTISEDDIITFVATAKTTGYIGFGFSNNTGMTNSDMIVGGVDDEGVPYLRDYSSRSPGQPDLDDAQDWTLISGSQTEEDTTLTFSRPLITADFENDVPIEDKEMQIIWSLGATDALQHHRNRGSTSFNLFQNTDSSTEPSESMTQETKTENVSKGTEIPMGTDLVKVTYSILGDIVTFIATGKTTGYIGFGFSNNTGMTNSDMIVGGVDDEGVSYLRDYSSRSQGPPNLDDAQDWTLISGSQTEDDTTLTFSRPLITLDFENDVPIEDKEMQIIWSLGATDNLQYHSNRGSTTFNLFQNTDSSTEPSESTTPESTTETVSESTAETSVETTPIETTTETPIETTTEEVLPGNGEIPLDTDLLKITYSILGESITFVATSKTTGYIGFGLSNSTGMFPADIFIGGVSDSGEMYFGDYKSTARTTPDRDPQQDWNLIYGLEIGDKTTLIFSRLLDTQDFENDVVIEDKVMNIIWALGSSDVITYHGTTRGITSYNLIGGQDPPPTTEPPATIIPTLPTTTEAPEEPSTEVSPGDGEIPLGTDLLRVTYSILGDNIMFVATAQGTGYVGFGFSNATGMFPGDIFIGGVTDGGEIYFGDYKSSAQALPVRDPQQDWVLVFGSETGNETTLVFSRLLSTMDIENDVVIEDKVMNIIWALGSSDTIAYHGATRGITTYNLIGGQAPPTTTEPSTPPTIPTTTEELPTTEVSPGNGEIPLGTDLLRVTYSILGDNIIFAATAQTAGYVGFGFSNETGMFPADIFIAGVRDGGDAYFGDYKSTAQALPARDPQQDWILVYGSETGNETTLIFSRLLTTLDLENDVVIEDKAMNIIWALGTSDDIAYHGATRGIISYNLIAGQAPPQTEPPTTTEDPDLTPGPTEAPGNGEIPMGTTLIRVAFTRVENVITFTATAKTLGWVAFGFSNGTGMPDADILIGGVNGGQPYGKDYVSRGYVKPEEDSTQNWELVSASESGDSTIITFSRLLDTGDVLDDVIIEDKQMTIIWAIGSTDSIEYHGKGNSGTTQYNLIQAPAILPPMDPLPNSIPLVTNVINVTYIIIEDTITFQVIGETRGFIGFGVNNGTGDSGGMNSADIFIAWVNDDGSVGSVDTFSLEEDTPTNDTESNWNLISGEEAGGLTRLVFSRLLDTGDSESDIVIEDSYLRIVWALGFTDFVTYHGESNRGKINSFNLIRGEPGDSSSERMEAFGVLNIILVLLSLIQL